jgi:hypothetical protein
MRVSGQPTTGPHYPRKRETVPIWQEAGWFPGLVWTGAENLAYTEIRFPKRPARRQSLKMKYMPIRKGKRRCYNIGYLSDDADSASA